jgi:hypothetical protein
VLIMPGVRGQPFCLGRPGRHHVVLPRKLALLGAPELFTALVSHELAHLAHRDVELSWLARSLSYVLAPMLAIPVIVALLQGEVLIGLDILWRAALLLGVVLLVVRDLLRARELDADLRATRTVGVEPVLDAALSRLPAAPNGWRAALAWHPEATQRRAVLADPGRAAMLTWLDGLTLGFLIALALPVVTGIASAGFLGANVAGLNALIASLVLGPLFGATIGTGLWRQALVARGSGRPPVTGPVALGVLAGALLGQLASLAGVGLGKPQLLIMVPLSLAGATVLIGGLGELWVSGIGRTRRAAAVWVPAAVFGAATATPLLWAAPQAESVLNSLGWPVLAAWLTTPAALLLPGIASTGLAAAAAWALRPRRDAAPPRWWGGPPLPPARLGLAAVGTGLAAGVAGGIALAVHRVLAGPAASNIDTIRRVDAAVLGSALVGVVVLVLLTLVRGTTGAGVGLLAGPTATVVTAATFLVVVAVVGGNPLPVAAHVLGGAVAAGFLLAAPASLVAVLGLPTLRRPTLGVTVAVAVIAGAGTAASAMVARQTMVPGLSAALPGYSEIQGGPVPDQAVAPPIPRELYRDVVARPLLQGRAAEAEAFSQLQAEQPPNDVAAGRIRSEIVPLLQAMLDGATDVRIDDPDLAAVHADLLAGIRLHLQSFELIATALERNDAALLQQGNALLQQGTKRWSRWAAGVAAL